MADLIEKIGRGDHPGTEYHFQRGPTACQIIRRQPSDAAA